MRKKTGNDYYWNSELVVNSQFNLAPGTRDVGSQRTGLLGYKVGMTCQWDKWGQQIPLTVVQVDRCQVVQQKTPERDGYSAL